MKVDQKLGTYQQQEGQAPTIEWDEITSHLNARYVSAPEATWRIFQFPLADRSHCIVRLAVHLPQSVYYGLSLRVLHHTRRASLEKCNFGRC